MKTYEEREYIKDLSMIMSLLQRASEILDKTEPPTADADDRRAELIDSVEKSLSLCEKALKDIL